MHICGIFLYLLGSLSLITCARNNASEATQTLLMNDEDDEFQELKKEDITTVPVSLEAVDELYNYWSEQGFSAIMASVADQRLQGLSATERKQHQKCAHRAHTVENHAKCVSKVLQWHEEKEKARKKFGDFKTFDFIKTKKFASIKNHRFRGKPLSERATRKNLMLLDHHKKLYSKELKTRRKPLFGDRKVNPEWENFKQQQSERRKLKRKLKKIPKKDHNTEEGEWVGGFRLRARRSVNELDQNEVPTLVHQRYSYVIPDENRLNPFGRLMRKLTNTVQLVKNKPVDNRRWQDRVLEIKQVGEKLQQKESARTAFQKRMETIQDTAKSLQFDMRKPLQLLGFFEKIGADINSDIGKFASQLNPATDLSEFNNDNRIDDEFMEPSRYKDDPVDMGDRPPESDKEKAIRLPMQLIRDGVKLGMSLSGKDTKNFEKKTIRLFSPKILEVAPGPRDNDTINLLSPKLLTMHNETTDDIEKMLSIQGAMKFMQDLNQQEMMNFILEASGVGDVIAKMKDADKAEDTLEKAGLDPRVFGSPELVEQFLKSMEKPRPAPDDDGLEDLDENGVKKFYADLKKEVEETKTEQDYDDEEDDDEEDEDGEEEEDNDFDDDDLDDLEKASDNKSEEPEGSGEGSGEEELFANLDLLIMDGLIADAANVTVDEKDNKLSGHHKKHRDQKHNKHKHIHHRGNGTRGHQRLNERATYKLQGPNGTLYLTKSKIKELYGEPELTRVLLFEKLHKSITKKQMEDFRKAGMTMLTPRQRRLLYGPGSPFEDKEALDRMRNITEDDLKLHLENTIHHLASKERPREYSFRKQNRTTTKPEDLENEPDGGPVATAKVGNYSVCIEFLSNGNCERWSPGASTKAPPETSTQRSAKLPQRRAAASGTGSAGTGGVSGSVSVCYGKGCKGGTTTPKPTTARPPPWGVIKTPVVYASVVRNSKMASQPFILSPILFSSVLFSPAVFGAIILSPWAFVATVGSPKVLSPVILSPPLWNLILLSPLVMDPILLSPGVGNPIILSPFVFTPFIISPQVMTPVILSPLVLSPIIMTPMALTPLILSPFVLTPIIMSPSYVGALVLSPSALSPGILSQGAIFTAILSPSLLS